MTARDRRFSAGALLLSVLVPGLLVLIAPFGEPRATFGTLTGWGAALLIMVPSYVLLARAMDAGNAHRFLRNFMLGTLLRLVLTFFLGYMLLTALELLLTVRGGPRGMNA